MTRKARFGVAPSAEETVTRASFTPNWGAMFLPSARFKTASPSPTSLLVLLAPGFLAVFSPLSAREKPRSSARLNIVAPAKLSISQNARPASLIARAPRLAQNLPSEAEKIETAPADPETTETAPIETVSEVPSGLVTTTPDSPLPVPSPETTPENEGGKATPATNKSQLLAARISYQGALVVAEGTPENLVQFTARGALIRAQKLTLDTQNQTVRASGEVFLARETTFVRRELRSRRLRRIEREEIFTSTARGQGLFYDFKAQTGEIDDAKLLLPQANIEAKNLTINGQIYTAQDVIVRPGGLTPEEIKIYGTPPFSLRAKKLTVFPGKTPGTDRLSAQGAGLYLGGTRLLPLPNSAIRVGGGRNADPTAPQITPRISFNSVDRILVRTRFLVPLTKKNPDDLAVLADVGFSQRVGFRGGASLQSQLPFGTFSLGYRKSDVVSTQLTNRIELDRRPEFSFLSRPFLDFDLPGGRRAGFSVEAGLGDYTERNLGSGNQVSATRTLGRVNFSTRLARRDGLFLNLFASSARYSDVNTSYNTTGYQLGYDSQLLPRVRGQISLLQTNLNGDTPFRFDRVEIATEARATFDVELSKRWLVPVDLRYDLDAERLRDETFGILRSYKNFAYGVVYQSARKDLRLEFRSAF